MNRRGSIKRSKKTAPWRAEGERELCKSGTEAGFDGKFQVCECAVFTPEMKSQ